MASRQRLLGMGDLLVAALLIAAGQLEVWAEGGVDGTLPAVIALVGTAPLAWRCRYPEGVLLLSAGALTALTVQGENQFPVAQLLGLMLAAYSITARRPIARAMPFVVLMLVAALANSAAAGSTVPGDYVFPFIMLGVPAAAGYSLQAWRLRTEQLHHLTEELRAEREAHAELVVAAERGRIARDLHDSLAQSLNAVVVHAEAGEAAAGRDEQRVATSFTRIQEVGRAALTETRKILSSLREEGVEQPRLDQLEQLLDRYRAAGLAISLDLTGDLSTVSPAIGSAVYRIVQESLTNVARHSAAGQASISIRCDGQLAVEVQDPGPPAKTTDHRTGFGMLGMSERAELLGGRLTAGRDGTGWTVRAWLPQEIDP